MVSALIIANRGEVACRVRAAKRMGIRTIAGYSDVEAQALWVKFADGMVASVARLEVWNEHFGH